MDVSDYLKFYDEERYLLDEVGPCFRQTGKLDAADFYTILIWKAERAKKHHKKRLEKIAGDSFRQAVAQIADDLYRCADGKHRLELLMRKWSFLLPTASAILTILYPEEFTVYDWRTCDELRCAYKPWCAQDFSEPLWNHYLSFKQTVIDRTPSGLSLREKDRFLIGRSTRKGIEAELAAQCPGDDTELRQGY